LHGVCFLAAYTLFERPFVGCDEEVGLELTAVPLKLGTQNRPVLQGKTMNKAITTASYPYEPCPDEILLMSNSSILSSGKLCRVVGLAGRSSVLTSKFVSPRNLLVDRAHLYCCKAIQNVQRGMSADIKETRTEGTAFAAPSCSESHGQFLEISRHSASGTGNAGHAQ